MPEDNPYSDNWPLTQIIAAAFDEWLTIQFFSPSFSDNNGEVEALATMITYKLLEAGLVDDASEVSSTHRF